MPSFYYSVDSSVLFPVISSELFPLSSSALSFLLNRRMAATNILVAALTIAATPTMVLSILFDMAVLGSLFFFSPCTDNFTKIYGMDACCEIFVEAL